ncbi:MAG: RHS repeat-associated core domain-containing protein [Sulfurovum sp.]|nr:RHS repeat-associated core domain-containing protein [Sulfurovum sp.]
MLKHTKEEETLNPYGYTGRETDQEDLYYYRARYYDPTTQRFLSQDPIEFEAGDFNFYRYVGNDPVNFRDPSGLVSAEILWKNRTFLSHYWLGGGDTMNIAPDSDIGKKIKKHLKDFMNKKCKEILEEASDTCGLYTTTKHDKDIDFTNNKDLFSLGNSNVKTRALCVDGKCLLSFEIKDAFEDAKDINDDTPDVMDEYPLATGYDIYYNSTMKCGY